MKRQGYNDRLDESLGMRRGPERDMKQGYKARRDESRGMKNAMKEMGHDKAPMKCNVPMGQGFKEVKPMKQGNMGYPKQAFDYKY